jgi:hypothetical protein
VLTAAAAAGWLGWTAWGHGADRPLAWRDLSDRTLAQPERSQLLAVSDERSLRAALGETATLPPIDFDERTGVLIAAGPRSTDAYALEVVRVTEERRRIVVSIRERAPSLARPGAARLTFPFRLITIARTEKPIELDWEGRP